MNAARLSRRVPRIMPIRANNDDAPPDENDFGEVNVQCRRCGAVLECYADHCPHCGQAMDTQFCATYQPRGSRVARVIAYVVLAAGVLIVAGLLIDVLRS